MNNNIWIKIPEKIKSDLDNDLENNFLIFKLQGAPESAMSFMLRKMILENFVPTVQFYNYLSEALLMNGYYSAAENVLLYSNIFLRISDNTRDFNNIEQMAVNKFINLIIAKNNRSIFDYMKNTLNINTSGLEEYFKVFKIDLKKGRECPFLNFYDFNLSDTQLKKFLKNDSYLIFYSNNIFRNKFEERLEELFFNEIEVLNLDNNNFYDDITIVRPVKPNFFNTEDGTSNNKAYSLLTEGMFNEALSECLKYMLNPLFMPTATFYIFFAKVLTLNGYLSDAMNVLLYTIIGSLKNSEITDNKILITSCELYEEIYHANLYSKSNLLKLLFKLSDLKNKSLLSVFSSSDSKEKILNFIKQDDGNYIFFKKKNIIFNYKEILVSNEIYSQILSGKIYNNEINCPIYDNLLINNTIKKTDDIDEYYNQVRDEKNAYEENKSVYKYAGTSQENNIISLMISIVITIIILSFALSHLNK